MDFYEFAIPAQFTGDQLQAHLKADSVCVRGNMLFVGSTTLTREQVEAKLATYVFVTPTPPTPEEKLFNATGLTVAEYKALGL